MILVGLTGGIGSGKSTVSAMLAAMGAEIIDADAITREVQQPGSAVVEAIAARFGDDLLDDNRALRRAALADIVFTEPDALRDLNRIVHPAVGAEISRRVGELASTDKVVVLDIPLLTERPRAGLQGKIVVDVPVDVQVERLVQVPRLHGGRRPCPHRSSGQPRRATEGRRLRRRQLRRGRRSRRSSRQAVAVADRASTAPRGLQARPMMTLADPIEHARSCFGDRIAVDRRRAIPHLCRTG